MTNPNDSLYVVYTRRPYKLRNFFFDVLMTILTAGFWLIWIFAREMRNR